MSKTKIRQVAVAVAVVLVVALGVLLAQVTAARPTDGQIEAAALDLFGTRNAALAGQPVDQLGRLVGGGTVQDITLGDDARATETSTVEQLGERSGSYDGYETTITVERVDAAFFGGSVRATITEWSAYTIPGETFRTEQSVTRSLVLEPGDPWRLVAVETEGGSTLPINDVEPSRS